MRSTLFKWLFGWAVMWVDGASGGSGGGSAGDGGASGGPAGDSGNEGAGPSSGLVGDMANEEVPDFDPDAATEEPSEDGAASNATAETISEDLARQAKEMGWTDEELAGTSPAALQAEMTRASRTLAKFGWTPDKTAPKTEPAAPAQASTTAPTDEVKALLDGLDAKEWGEALPKALQGIHGHYTNQITGLQQQVGQMAQILSAVLTENEQREFDGQVNGLGDEYAAILGKGDRSAIAANKEAMEARGKVWSRYVDLLNKVGTNNGMSKGTLLRMAVAAELGEKVREGARKQVQSEVEKRKGQMMVKPATRQTVKPQLGPREEAIKAIRDYEKKHGLADDE